VPDGSKRTLRLSAEAKAVWVEFFNETGKEVGELTGAEASVVSKAKGIAGRLALLFHVCREASAEPRIGDEISEVDMAAGIRLSRWFAREWRRCWLISRGEIDSEGGDDKAEQSDAEVLLEWLAGQEEGEATMRQLKWSGPRRLRGKEGIEALQEAIQELIDTGKVELIHRKPAHGGRASVVLKVKDE
jgi:hypothetical protein